MASDRVHLRVEDGVAIIQMSNPPMNSLAPDILLGLKIYFEEAHRRDDVKAIVVQGADGKFSAGFDISTIAKIQEEGTMSIVRVSVDLMIDAIEAGPKPSVAAIEGLALGGGLEVAMSCHSRLCIPKTELGLPELQLGVIPGGGGTQRLPRLVGLQKALDMMLRSAPVKSDEALELGLVDAVVPPDQLLATAKQFALEMAAHQRPWLQSLYRTDRLEPFGECKETLRFVRDQVKQTAPNLTHPLRCLDAVQAGIDFGGYKGNLEEEAIFRELIFSDTSKALTHIFFAQRNTAKVPGVTDRGLKPRPCKSVGVIGGGLMGAGIITALITANVPVVLKEANEKFLTQAFDRIQSNLKSKVKKGKMTQEEVDELIASKVKGTLDYKDLSNVDLVIEAVIESVPLKQQIFVDLERHCKPSCVLASNTSTIDLEVVGAKTRAHSRIVGAHFFSPAHIMPLLEVVRTKHSEPQAVLDFITLGKKIKKTPVVVGNCTGFAVNRSFFPYTMASALLVDAGIDMYRIDKVIAAFGMPMGPFRLMDLVGLEVGKAIGMQYLEVFPDRTYKSMLVPMLVDGKRVGEKVSKGFYNYTGRKNKPAPEMAEYVKKSREAANLSVKDLKVTDKDILEMIFFPVVNEACRVLEEKIVVHSSDLDIATVMSMGFPPYRGGLIFWADTVGAKYIHSRLEQWASTFGGFFAPSPYLQKCARSGRKLGDHVVDAKL